MKEGPPDWRPPLSRMCAVSRKCEKNQPRVKNIYAIQTELRVPTSLRDGRATGELWLTIWVKEPSGRDISAPRSVSAPRE